MHEGGVIRDAAGGVIEAYETEIIYRADMPYSTRKWRPSIYMPRSASRIALRVTDVRAERLQWISQPDAIAEGISRVGQRWEAEGICTTPTSAGDAYRGLWEYINGPGSWDANPWIWVVSFERIESQRVAA
ncbi:MAG: hypothetical protein ACREUT_02210 [Steroidobacteraceae bacterium]